MPTRVLQFQTPLHSLKQLFSLCRIYSELPLKVFGCTCFVCVPQIFRSKLEPTPEKFVFLGYAQNKKGYKCFNTVTKKTYISMDVSFLETQPYFPKNHL